MNDKVERLKEIERRGLLGRLSEDERARWMEYKHRHPEEFEPTTISSLKPLSEENKAKPKNAFGWDVIGQGLKGYGQGLVSGLGQAASGATFGATDWIDRKTGGHLAALDEELQGLAESNNLGFANKAAKFAANLGGNIAGGGGALVKGLSNTGLKGLKLASTAGGAEGLAYGLTGSDSMQEVLPNMAVGLSIGAAAPVILHGAGRLGQGLIKPFSSRLMTAGQHGGLENVASNSKAVKVLKKGIRIDDDIAQQYLDNFWPAARNINKETAGMIDNALTNRINVPKTIAAERAKYADFMAKHGADEVLDFTPTRKHLADYKAQSSFNPNNYSKETAENVLRERANKSGIEIGGDINHYLKDGKRTQIIRTLDNTINKPDITYSQNGRNYFVKKYNTEEKPFFDFIVKQDGKLFNKFPVNDKYLGNQLKKNVQDASLNNEIVNYGRSMRETIYNPNNNIPRQSVVVNPKLQHISSLYDGLTPFQSEQLDKALKTGLSKTNQKAGSLESLNKAKQEINEMISKAQSTDRPSEVWQLQELKKKFDGAMPESLKDIDKEFAHAKRLEDAFDKGTHYNPNNVTGADMIAGLPVDEQNAFTQGLFKRINNNWLSGKDLANDALKYENTLSQVLPQETYDPLIYGLNRQATRFGRLAKLGRDAESRLQMPESTRFFGREQLESKGSMLGTGLDWMNNLFRGRAIRRASLDLLNPEFVGQPVGETFVVRNPNLSAGITPLGLSHTGLSPFALYNLMKQQNQ